MNDNIQELIQMMYCPKKRPVQLSNISTFADLNITLPEHLKYAMQPKNCYKNAAKVAQFLYHSKYDCRYIEGYVTYRKEIPLEHAFVGLSLDGTEYILDPTIEFVMKESLEEISSELYFDLWSCSPSEIYTYMNKFQKWGPWNNYTRH